MSRPATGLAKWLAVRALLVTAGLTLAGNAPLARPTEAAELVVGAKPWVTILCRFADFPAVTPKPKNYFEGLMGSSYPGLDHYWREVSYDAIDLSGSIVVGWYDLPREEAHYLVERFGTIQYDYDRTLADCTGAADADVFLPAFEGITLVFNRPLCCANGAQVALTRDGQSKIYRVVWLPSSHSTHQAILAHEMGHTFGLPHSSGPYGETYDNGWDVMSGTGGPRCLPTAEYGCAGQHTIAYHKDLLGWIPSARKFVAPSGSSQTIRMEHLALPGAGDGYLMAKIPISGSADHFYTVEARRFVGYDSSGIPGEAIVIHRIDETIVPPPGLPGVPRAFVVDPDVNGNPNDVGAMWLPGETFSDAANGIAISVLASTLSGWEVTIINDDTTAPTIVPTSSITTDNGLLTLHGTAADNVGVTQVTWSNHRGGSGSAAGTGMWAIDGIVLAPGINRISVTARDAVGNKGSSTVRVLFFADTLTRQMTPVRAIHFLDLAEAVDDLRTSRGLPPIQWSHEAPASGGVIKARHLNDLRTALAGLCDLITCSPFTREGISQGTPVNAAHLQALRDVISQLP